MCLFKKIEIEEKGRMVRVVVVHEIMVEAQAVDKR